ncbi:MAG: twin-arginine translocation signal domain-containing protein, partial [Planctomycetota bacterium]
MNQISGTMNRRAFLKLTAASAAAFTLPGCASVSQGRVSEQAKRPNVLFIAIDDLNDWVGCLGGHPDVRTPNLDKLAQRGVLFTNAQCSAPACNPSRASLMTGILPSTSGVYKNPHPWRKSPVLSDAATLPQHFMAHGYRVVGGGK